MRKNSLLTKLRAGQPTAGCWMNCGSPLMVEIAAHAGFDWILIDTQHGYWSEETIIGAFQVIAATETVPVARVLSNDFGLIGHLLDMGALGVIVPLVNTPEDAARAVAAMRYPPRGGRSTGGSRLPLYGQDYFQRANSEIMASIMIESREAADRAEEIMAVPGLDMVLIGPADLRLSLGEDTSQHEALIQKVLAAGKKKGVPVGIYTATVEDAKRRAAEGFTFMPSCTDTTMFSLALRDTVQEWQR